MNWKGHTNGQIIITLDIRAEADDTLVRELSRVINEVHCIVDHEEGEVLLNLPDTIIHLQAIIHLVASETIIARYLNRKVLII